MALHTDFRIYWPARWRSLAEVLESSSKGTLEVIEIFGKGSPYAFNTENNDTGLKWHVLYPEASPEQIGGKEIKPSLFRLLDEINPDVIISGAIAYPSGALAVQWALSRQDKRVICFDDAKRNAVVRNHVVDFVKRNVYDGVDAMFYPAEPWIETGKSWGFNKDEMFFGVDVVDNDFWQTPCGKSTITQPYLLAVGRQIPKKNFPGAVKAYAMYADRVGRDNAIPLVLVGDGPEHEEIVREIELAKLSDKVILMPFQSQGSVRNLMQHALLLLLSSEAETWGLVINEAMNCGCAVVSNRECGATDVLVREGINGYKTDYANIKGVAEALVKYHSLQDAERIAMDEASKDIIADWGLDRFADGAIKAIESVVSHRKRTPNPLGRIIVNVWNGRYNPV